MNTARKREHVVWSNRPESSEGGSRYYFNLDPNSVQLIREVKDIIQSDGLSAVSVGLILKRGLQVYREYLEGAAGLNTAEGRLRERQRLTDIKERK